ncbi:hypothetical protein [Hymenobacter aerophilus]|uniref:hypothetical protein n=1 Tax=Hymenobacter aerophilus TaxID=119644 RepID=UPI0012FA41AF|nr:hypothetical protein [Hymenobacter aerophilus]
MYSEKVFHDFLSNTEFTENEISVLMLAYSNANGITAPQVAESLGYKHFLTANGIVGRLGKKLAAQVSDVNIDDKSIQWWTLLFIGV